MGRFGEDQSTVNRIRKPSKAEDVWDYCVNFAALAVRVVMCHVSCQTKLCTGSLVHPPARCWRATVNRIQRPTEDEDVENCCVNFATLALRVLHRSVPRFMSKETVHLCSDWYASDDSCMPWKRISNQRMGFGVLRLPRLSVQLHKLSISVLMWFE